MYSKKQEIFIMPRAKTSIKTLLDTCLENVTRNMDEWCSHYVETYGKDKKFYRFVVGPFDPLRKSLVIQSYQEVYIALLILYFLQLPNYWFRLSAYSEKKND